MPKEQTLMELYCDENGVLISRNWISLRPPTEAQKEELRKDNIAQFIKSLAILSKLQQKKEKS